MNRRDFLRSVIIAAIIARVDKNKSVLADTSVPLDPTVVALFSDVHIHGPETTQHVVRFNACVTKVLAMNPRPANLLIYGDVAYLTGKVEEYELFRKLIKPIEDAGIHWEIAMGNHDRLTNYQKVFPERFEKPQPIKNRYINIVKTPNADFILLDSYEEGQVKGSICPEEREWLIETLKGYTQKHCFTGCHHPLSQTKIADILSETPKHVAYLYGHHHYYRSSIQKGVPTVCFPSVGHWGDLGFVTARITSDEAVFVPDIDAYLWSKAGYIKEPVQDITPYLEKLNKDVPTFKLS